MNVQYNLANWSYAQYNEYIRLIGESKFREAGYMVELLIVDWERIEGADPKAKHPIDTLPMEVSVAIVLQVRESIKDYVESLGDDDIIVDLSKWSWDDFNKFKDYTSKEETLDKAIQMMRQVVRLKGLTQKAELNALHGNAMMKALTDKIGRVFSGGN